MTGRRVAVVGAGVTMDGKRIISDVVDDVAPSPPPHAAATRIPISISRRFMPRR